MKRFSCLLLGLLFGLLLLLQAGCAVQGTVYPAYPSYGGYYWYPYSGYYWGPSYYGSYWWPYPYYSYRDYRYRYHPRYWDGDDHYRRPRPPQHPPPDRKPYPLKPPVPKGGGRPPLDRPIPR